MIQLAEAYEKAHFYIWYKNVKNTFSRPSAKFIFSQEAID